MRYANLNPKDTLKIYEVYEKSLALYRPKNKYGFSNYPHHDSRLVKDEIKGADDLKAEEEEKKLQEEIKRLEQKEMEAMDFDPDQGDRFSILEQPEDKFTDSSMDKERQSFNEESRASVCIRAKNPINTKVTLDDFELISQLGRGAFGKVFLAKLVTTGTEYAMKVIRKDVLIEYDQIESTQLEKEILFAADHPFLVGMEFLFQSETRLYFVMPFIRGGELYKVFQSEKRFSEETVKFYAVQIILAVGELHKKGIMHRDLKLENILVDERGYLKIIDYGLAKIIKGQELAMSYCGTPEYLAPEMVQSQGHDFTVDWWALGILIYEMMFGQTPFFNRNRKLLESKIKHGRIVFPDRAQYRIDYTDELVDLVKQLLIRDRTKRLGAENGMKEILSHPFFADVSVA